MDKEFFVQKVKMLCLVKGVKPTNACKESGVGGSFINDVERGRVPSVEKVQMLATYLGVTTSELIGETAGPSPPVSTDSGPTAEEWALLLAYRAADDRAKQVVDLTLEPWKKSSASDVAM